MDIRQSLEQLVREMRRRGLPRPYIQRYVEELSDHINDFVEERSNAMSKEAHGSTDLPPRIGDPIRLAQVAAAEYRRANFWGRHPIVTFLLAPIPLVVVAWIAVFVLGMLIMSGRAESGDGADSWSIAAIWASIVWFRVASVIPPALVALLLCYLARRGGLSWRWSLAACLLVAIVAGLFRGQLELPRSMSRGQLSLGFGFGLAGWFQQLLQFSLPLATGLGFALRMAKQPADSTSAEITESAEGHRQAA
jgi:hypothetical protein